MAKTNVRVLKKKKKLNVLISKNEKYHLFA